jgi:hypothetical protein
MVVPEGRFACRSQFWKLSGPPSGTEGGELGRVHARGTERFPGRAPCATPDRSDTDSGTLVDVTDRQGKAWQWDTRGCETFVLGHGTRETEAGPMGDNRPRYDLLTTTTSGRCKGSRLQLAAGGYRLDPAWIPLAYYRLRCVCRLRVG